MEGKEVRFGPAACGLFAATTTGTSTGAVNCAHDSFTPGGGAVPLVNMMLGEVSPGGVGAGLYGMLIFALLAVFIAGLMVGRTPEYLGKKIQAAEMKLVVLYILARAARGARLHRRLGRAGHGQGVDPQPRAARAHRGRLRLHLGRQQQRLGVRRPHRQHRLVQHDARPGDAGRPVPADRPRAGHRRLARPQAAGARRRPAPSRPARRCSPACSSASSSSSSASPTSPSSPSAPSSSSSACERSATMSDATLDIPEQPEPGSPVPSRPGARPAGRCSTRPSCGGRRSTASVKLDPRPDGAQPGHVRRRGRQRAHHASCSSATSTAPRRDENLFAGLVAAWLWFTVLFANFAEAMAEGRGKAQADTLRKTRSETVANRRRADGSRRARAVDAARRRRRVRRDGRRDDPARRRGHRGHRHRSTSRPSPASRRR